MDKSAGNKKRSPAGTSRKAYGIFGGIINLTQSHGVKSNAVPSRNVNVVGSPSSNIYTVTVSNSQNPAECSTNQAKTYENVSAMKKKKGDQSLSTVSSLTNACGMSNSSTGGNSGNGNSASGPIGPAPATLSILTALNELAISDEIAFNPTCSPLTPSAAANLSNNGRGAANISRLTSPHSSCLLRSKRSSSSSGNYYNVSSSSTHQTHESPTNATLSSSAKLYQSSPSTATTLFHSNPGSGSSSSYVYNPSGSVNSGARLKGYPDTHRNVPSAAPNVAPLLSCSNTRSTLPSKVRPRNKSLGGHKEASQRKGAATRQRDRSKSRTPDWIWKIFQLTKNGKLQELQQSLLELDPTLIRHLADAKGNTVLHCAARGGHVNTLQWLVSVLGSQCTEAALSDHNQAGRTVILTALKKGQLQCLQWLVRHTKCGEKALVPNEGERSLLHFAATYGDINVVRWLCTELIDKGISVDIRDTGGLTPLMMAAKYGHITVCHELILAGADPLSQTELGWRPSDLAIRHRHMECASYFLVAEAAGSLGNQLHSLLFAFNHLRQEHEELRSHFRETLRVGKWLAKERNDLIKHFPSSKWSQEATSSSLLLGGTNNGARFSYMEHKLVIADQAWKKISQNTDDTTADAFLNGDEALLSNLSSRDFLHRRLAALQLRHERNQSLRNNLSGSSDEDVYYESSSTDTSSSDVEVDSRVTSLPAESSGRGINSAAPAGLIHSSNVSLQTEKTTMKTRSKAAPWLLPPNDAFLSQLSPFVGAHEGKSLPTLDLLHGAPSSPSSFLSPIVIPPSPASASVSATVSPLTTTDAAGKNEKSLVQMDVERHGGSHAGKRDSTALDISVLEVIEPTSQVSPSACKKKVEDGMEQFHVSSSRPWLDFSDQSRGILRSLPKCAMETRSPEPSLETEGGNKSSNIGFGGGESGFLSSGRRSTGLLKTSIVATSEACSGSDTTSSSSRREFFKRSVENEEQLVASSVHHQAPDLICGTHYRQHMGTQQSKKSRRSSLRERQQPEDYYSHSHRHDVSDQVDALYEPISIHASDHKKLLPADENSRLDVRSVQPPTTVPNEVAADSVKGESVSKDQSRSHRVAKSGSDQPLAGPSSTLPRIPLSLCKIKSPETEKSGASDSRKEEIESSDIIAACSASVANSEKTCFSSDAERNSVVSLAFATSTNDGGSDGGAAIGRSRGISSTSQRIPSPKSYITKLTVMPVEASTETCFLSVRPPASFGGEDEDQEADSLLHIPGENQDEVCLGALSCQIPSDSVSSSNTPVMPRFNSSGTVVFPFRKSDWHSSELLSLTTPDSSLACRLSPTPSETSRTESAHAPPASYVSFASQNSEASKTESARGHTSEVGTDADADLEVPSGSAQRDGYINDSDHCEYIHQPIVVSSEQKSESNGSNNNIDLEEHVAKPDTENSEHSYDQLNIGSKKSRDYSNSVSQEEEVEFAEGEGGGSSDNAGSRMRTIPTTVKPRSGRLFATRRMHTSNGFIRSHLSTGIHKAGAQRLPKGHRGHSKPWYEIEGSDDEGSLLRAATKSRSSNSSNFPSTTGNNEVEESRISYESEDNDNNNGNTEVEQEQEAEGEDDCNEENGPPTQQNLSKHNCSNFL